ncbi:hypothetical protein SD70_07375 [Gordoniibacillus kamchatkensis]|uniref:SHSP domain-containing protein n=1 Tax=Gordoniibacillus kamchatkensis TaxID=1590651 RepID=A0ABR5AKA9_9BACL|nr:Hsp20/alpha crystallin family protein [Paenibacillus sp. VKM B-2647]KIL41449.1 hypothetical protein SD70_07375 [Paenibacillus sp. VKM B-2647]
MRDKQQPSPNHEWSSFNEQANEVLGEQFWHDIAGLIPNTGPRIDVYYTPNTVVVVAELPGLLRSDQISIRLEGQSLVLEGDLPRLYPATDKQITLKERFFGSFRRSLPMPKPVARNDIRAKYSQGLLIVELQIEQHEQLTHIPIDF